MDIDIDIKPNVNVLHLFPDVTQASIVEKGILKKHLVGHYFQNIPKDQISGLAAIPYNKAEEYGFFKIDLLHLTMLDIFESKKEIKMLLKNEPDWNLLLVEDVVKKCFHISNHFDLIKKTKPKSILELADVLALIRPNKISLLDKYLKDKEKTRTELYKKTDKSDLRKSHAIPYALLIVVQLHLIKADII